MSFYFQGLHLHGVTSCALNDIAPALPLRHLNTVMEKEHKSIYSKSYGLERQKKSGNVQRRIVNSIRKFCSVMFSNKNMPANEAFNVLNKKNTTKAADINTSMSSSED